MKQQQQPIEQSAEQCDNATATASTPNKQRPHNRGCSLSVRITATERIRSGLRAGCDPMGFDSGSY